MRIAFRWLNNDDGVGTDPSIAIDNLELSVPPSDIAPTISYAPTTGSDVSFSGVTSIGTTGNGSILATPSGGAGNGDGATTTISTCTLAGTNPGSFAGATAVNLSFVGNTLMAQNISLSCISQQSVQNATLTCNETRGSDPALQRQWPLICPAGTLLPITASPISGATVNLVGTAGGSSGTTTIVLTNPNPIAVSLTCSAPVFPFTAGPLAFSIPSGADLPIVIGISPAAAGSYFGSLTCNVPSSAQTLSFNLAGTLAPMRTVDVMSGGSRWLLLILILVIGLVLGFVGRR